MPTPGLTHTWDTHDLAHASSAGVITGYGVWICALCLDTVGSGFDTIYLAAWLRLDQCVMGGNHGFRIWHHLPVTRVSYHQDFHGYLLLSRISLLWHHEVRISNHLPVARVSCHGYFLLSRISLLWHHGFRIWHHLPGRVLFRWETLSFILHKVCNGWICSVLWGPVTHVVWTQTVSFSSITVASTRKLPDKLMQLWYNVSQAFQTMAQNQVSDGPTLHRQSVLQRFCARISFCCHGDLYLINLPKCRINGDNCSFWWTWLIYRIWLKHTEP